MKLPSDEPNTLGAKKPLLSDAQCHLVLKVALIYARRNRVQGEDSEDQALAFLLHLWLYLQDHPQTDRSLLLSAAWLARTADNWMKNSLRTQRRRRFRELPWPSETAEAGETAALFEPPSQEPSPDREAIRAEFSERVHSAITHAHLTAAQYELIDHLLEGKQASDIARSLGLPSQTIRQRIRTLRVHLCKTMAGCDLGDAEIQEYLSILNLSNQQGTRP